MDPADSLNDLASRVAVGDASALQQFLYYQTRPLLGFVFKILPHRLASQIDPQDILQDAFVDIYRRVEAIRTVAADGPQSLERWIKTIVRRRVAKLYRRHRAAAGPAAAFNEAELDADSIVGLFAEMAVHSRTPSKSAARHELADDIVAAIQMLPETYRLAMTRRYLEGNTAAEVAREIGRSEQAVHNICNRAMRALRLQLRGHRGG